MLNSIYKKDFFANCFFFFYFFWKIMSDSLEIQILLVFISYASSFGTFSGLLRFCVLQSYICIGFKQYPVNINCTTQYAILW